MEVMLQFVAIMHFNNLYMYLGPSCTNFDGLGSVYLKYHIKFKSQQMMIIYDRILLVHIDYLVSELTC